MHTSPRPECHLRCRLMECTPCKLQMYRIAILLHAISESSNLSMESLSMRRLLSLYVFCFSFFRFILIFPSFGRRMYVTEICEYINAFQLLDTGAYIGSLIIDNVECYDDIPLLTSVSGTAYLLKCMIYKLQLMATAVSKMTRRTANGATNLGRMVIVTAETARDLKKGSKMWIDTIIDS